MYLRVRRQGLDKAETLQACLADDLEMPWRYLCQDEMLHSLHLSVVELTLIGCNSHVFLLEIGHASSCSDTSKGPAFHPTILHL